MSNRFAFKLFISIFCISVWSSQAAAGSKNFGIGFVAGQPSGISALYTTSIHRAIDFTVSYDLSRNFNAFLFMGDYLFRKPESLQIGKVDFGWYWGAGVFYLQHNRPLDLIGVDFFRAGPRLPIGAYYVFSTIPVEAYIEIGIGFSILPSIELEPTGGIGARYFF